MTQYLNNAEGGTNGVAVTPANSGGASGTAWSQVVNNGDSDSTAVTFDNTHAANGTLSYLFQTDFDSDSDAGQIYLQWNLAGEGKYFFRIYLYLPSTPGQNWPLLTLMGQDGDDTCATLRITTGRILQFLNASGSEEIQSVAQVATGQWVRIEGYVVGSSTAGQLSFSYYSSPSSTTPTDSQTSDTDTNTHGLVYFAQFGNTSTSENLTLQYWMDNLGISDAALLGPVQPTDSDFGTFSDAQQVIGTVHQSSSDTGSFTEALKGSAGAGIKSPMADFDTGGTDPVFGEQGTTPDIWGELPTSLPMTLGTLQPPAAAVAGNSWEIQVRSYQDFTTLLAVIPRYTAFSFSKLLSDKGSGTISISLDDAIWKQTFGGAYYTESFETGAAANWQGTNGNVSTSTFWSSDGNHSVLLTATGDNAEVRSIYYPVTPGQNVQAIMTLYAPAGTANGFLEISWRTASGTEVATTTQPVGLLGGNFINAQEVAVIGQAPLGLNVTQFAVTFGWDQTGVSGQLMYGDELMVSVNSGLPASALVDYENLWQVYFRGRCVFEFLGETVTEQLVDQSEERVVTVTGPGTVATLGWARAMPPGFPEIVFKTDAIQDGFAEIDQHGNPLLDQSIWNLAAPLTDITLNPPGTCQITATPGTTYLAGGPYDITSSSFAAQMIPMTGATLDGSQITQFYIQDENDPGNYALIGLSSTAFYCQVGDDVKNTVSTKTLNSYDAGSDTYWQISEKNGIFYFWTSADGQNWVKQYQVAYGWTATTINVVIAATYDSPGGAFVGVTNVNADVVTPTSAGNVYFGEPIMGVWYDLFQQAQSRGTIQFVTTRLNGSQDSFGNPWTDSQSVQIQNGTDLFSLLQSHAAMVNAQWIMQPGFNLLVGLPLSQGQSGVSLGIDHSQSVIFHESDAETQKQRTRARDQVANLVGAVNSDGTVVSAGNSGSIATWNQREGWVQTATQVNPESMNIVVAASLTQTEDEILSWTLQVLHDKTGRTVFADYDVGDWVGLERAQSMLTMQSVTDAVQVTGIAISIDATGGVTAELTLNSYRQWLAEQLQYLVNKFGGQFINSLGTTPVTSNAASPTGVPQVVSPSLGGLNGVTLG